MKFQCVRIWRVWQSFTYKYVPRFEGNWLFEEVFFTLSSIKLCFFAETAPVTTHWGDVILHANLLFLNFMWNGVKSVHRCWRSFPKKPLYTTYRNVNLSFALSNHNWLMIREWETFVGFYKLKTIEQNLSNQSTT